MGARMLETNHRCNMYRCPRLGSISSVPQSVAKSETRRWKAAQLEVWTGMILLGLVRLTIRLISNGKACPDV